MQQAPTEIYALACSPARGTGMLGDAKQVVIYRNGASLDVIGPARAKHGVAQTCRA